MNISPYGLMILASLPMLSLGLYMAVQKWRRDHASEKHHPAE